MTDELIESRRNFEYLFGYTGVSIYYVLGDGSGPAEGVSGVTGVVYDFKTPVEAARKIEELKGFSPGSLVDFVRGITDKGMIMRTLEFSNNVHEVDKLQVTVRRGTKWSDLSPRELVALSEIGGGSKRAAEVVFVHKCLLGDVPESSLEYEHDPSCRTLCGLKMGLDRVYGDRVGDDEIVTMVCYRPL